VKSAPLYRRLLLLASAGSLVNWLAACTSAPKAVVSLPPVRPAPLPEPAPEPPVVQAKPIEELPPDKISVAMNERDYRRDAASHLYSMNNHRIFQGRLPALLYAVGVLRVQVDRQGRVQHLDWMRAPRHAPEVIAEIERTVREAAPFPAPVKMGRVVYTDTWLWHKSGRFQLDTLTEGQA